MCATVAENGHVELLERMRAQRPPCPCDFNACLEVAEDKAVWAYFQTGLDLLRMCGIRTETMTATETADAVALIDQGADLHAKDSYGGTPPCTVLVGMVM